MKPPFLLANLSLAGLALVSTGCSALRAKPDLTRFYVLRAQALNPPSTPAPAAASVSLVVGRGQLADYLNSTPIVVTDGPNRVRRLDQHQWAEPLAQGVSRILVEDLGQLVKGADVVAYPDLATRPAAYELRYSIFKLEGAPGTDVVLEVSWLLRQQPAGRTVAESISTFKVPAAGTSEDVKDYVARLSRALDDWSAVVARALAPELNRGS